MKCTWFQCLNQAMKISRSSCLSFIKNLELTQLRFFNRERSSTFIVFLPHFFFILHYMSPAECKEEKGTIAFQTYLLCITVPTHADASKNAEEVQTSKTLRKGGW